MFKPSNCMVISIPNINNGKVPGMVILIENINTAIVPGNDILIENSNRANINPETSSQVHAQPKNSD